MDNLAHTVEWVNNNIMWATNLALRMMAHLDCFNQLAKCKKHIRHRIIVAMTVTIPLQFTNSFGYFVPVKESVTNDAPKFYELLTKAFLKIKSCQQKNLGLNTNIPVLLDLFALAFQNNLVELEAPKGPMLHYLEYASHSKPSGDLKMLVERLPYTDWIPKARVVPSIVTNEGATSSEGSSDDGTSNDETPKRGGEYMSLGVFLLNMVGWKNQYPPEFEALRRHLEELLPDKLHEFGKEIKDPVENKTNQELSEHQADYFISKITLKSHLGADYENEITTDKQYRACDEGLRNMAMDLVSKAMAVNNVRAVMRHTMEEKLAAVGDENNGDDIDLTPLKVAELLTKPAKTTRKKKTNDAEVVEGTDNNDGIQDFGLNGAPRHGPISEERQKDLTSLTQKTMNICAAAFSQNFLQHNLEVLKDYPASSEQEDSPQFAHLALHMMEKDSITSKLLSNGIVAPDKYDDGRSNFVEEDEMVTYGGVDKPVAELQETINYLEGQLRRFESTMSSPFPAQSPTNRTTPSSARRRTPSNSDPIDSPSSVDDARENRKTQFALKRLRKQVAERAAGQSDGEVERLQERLQRLEKVHQELRSEVQQVLDSNLSASKKLEKIETILAPIRPEEPVDPSVFFDNTEEYNGPVGNSEEEEEEEEEDHNDDDTSSSASTTPNRSESHRLGGKRPSQQQATPGPSKRARANPVQPSQPPSSTRAATATAKDINPPDIEEEEEGHQPKNLVGSFETATGAQKPLPGEIHLETATGAQKPLPGEIQIPYDVGATPQATSRTKPKDDAIGPDLETATGDQKPLPGEIQIPSPDKSFDDVGATPQATSRTKPKDDAIGSEFGIQYDAYYKIPPPTPKPRKKTTPKKGRKRTSTQKEATPKKEETPSMEQDKKDKMTKRYHEMRKQAKADKDAFRKFSHYCTNYNMVRGGGKKETGSMCILWDLWEKEYELVKRELQIQTGVLKIPNKQAFVHASKRYEHNKFYRMGRQLINDRFTKSNKEEEAIWMESRASRYADVEELEAIAAGAAAPTLVEPTPTTTKKKKDPVHSDEEPRPAGGPATASVGSTTAHPKSVVTSESEAAAEDCDTIQTEADHGGIVAKAILDVLTDAQRTRYEDKVASDFSIALENQTAERYTLEELAADCHSEVTKIVKKAANKPNREPLHWGMQQTYFYVDVVALASAARRAKIKRPPKDKDGVKVDVDDKIKFCKSVFRKCDPHMQDRFKRYTPDPLDTFPMGMPTKVWLIYDVLLGIIFEKENRHSWMPSGLTIKKVLEKEKLQYPISQFMVELEKELEKDGKTHEIRLKDHRDIIEGSLQLYCRFRTAAKRGRKLMRDHCNQGENLDETSLESAHALVAMYDNVRAAFKREHRAFSAEPMVWSLIFFHTQDLAHYFPGNKVDILRHAKPYHALEVVDLALDPVTEVKEKLEQLEHLFTAEEEKEAKAKLEATAEEDSIPLTPLKDRKEIVITKSEEEQARKETELARKQEEEAEAKKKQEDEARENRKAAPAAPADSMRRSPRLVKRTEQGQENSPVGEEGSTNRSPGVPKSAGKAEGIPESEVKAAVGEQPSKEKEGEDRKMTPAEKAQYQQQQQQQQQEEEEEEVLVTPKLSLNLSKEAKRSRDGSGSRRPMEEYCNPITPKAPTLSLSAVSKQQSRRDSTSQTRRPSARKQQQSSMNSFLLKPNDQTGSGRKTNSGTKRKSPCDEEGSQESNSLATSNSAKKGILQACQTARKQGKISSSTKKSRTGSSSKKKKRKPSPSASQKKITPFTRASASASKRT